MQNKFASRLGNSGVSWGLKVFLQGCDRDFWFEAQFSGKTAWKGVSRLREDSGKVRLGLGGFSL